MKLIDGNKRITTLDKYCDKIAGAPELFMKIGPLNIPLPKKLLYDIMNAHKFWEADSVNDIKENYGMISLTEKVLDDKQLEYYKRQIQESINGNIDSFRDILDYTRSALHLKHDINKVLKRTGSREGYSNNNLVILDNVYLGDYNFGQTSWYKYCELTVKDRFSNTIPAVVLYDTPIHRVVQNVDESELERQLFMAKSHPDYSTAFDISFRAIPAPTDTQWMDFIKGLAGERKQGQELQILEIRKTGGNKEDYFPVNVGDFMPCYS